MRYIKYDSQRDETVPMVEKDSTLISLHNKGIKELIFIETILNFEVRHCKRHCLC